MADGEDDSEHDGNVVPIRRPSRSRWLAQWPITLVLIGVYPLITAIIYAVAPFTEGWAIWERNLIVAPLMVVAMIYFVIPTIQKRFGKFIASGKW